MRFHPALLAVILALLSCSAHSQIVVEPGGVYPTIQAGVDAASATGGTVLVMPGVYTDSHLVEINWVVYRVQVYFEKGITLTSAGGPEVTILDGGGVTDFGIVGLPYDMSVPGVPLPLATPIVEGFTVRNGRYSYPSKGIVAIAGEARDNIVSGYYFGLASGFGHDYTGISGGRSRDEVSLITGNTATGNSSGVRIESMEEGFFEAHITGNTLTGNDYGVSATGPDNRALLADNEICDNGTGIFVQQGSSTSSGLVHLEMVRNLIADNTSANIRVYNAWSHGGHWTDLDIGGSPGNANDIYGAAQNVKVVVDGGMDVDVDARYNYWGSVFCDEFVPLFSVSGAPDSLLQFLPYVDGTHTVVYEDCEYSAIENVTWGAIKALYR